MAKFVSNTKNKYELKSNVSNEMRKKESFIPKTKAESIYMFKNSTENITGRKVKFKHV